MSEIKDKGNQKLLDNNKLRQLILIVLIIIVGYLLIKSVGSDGTDNGKAVFIDTAVDSDADLAAPIIVHIKGEVVNPGVYEIKGDFRLKDAIDAAGGLTENADSDALNLAMFLNDGDEIIIPAKGGTLKVNPSDVSRSVIVSPSSLSSSGITARVNINTATIDQLTALPGIGKSLAEQIVQYRTYLKFNSVEDLKNVPGIGNSKFDNIRDYVYVN